MPKSQQEIDDNNRYADERIREARSHLLEVAAMLDALEKPHDDSFHRKFKADDIAACLSEIIWGWA